MRSRNRGGPVCPPGPPPSRCALWRASPKPCGGGTRRSAPTALLLLVVATGACVHPAPPALPSPPAMATLRREIDAALAQPMLARGYWGVLVKSLKTDETLYALNAGKLMLPASNMKIVTLAAAAEKLGWDFRYDTRLVAAGV